MSAVASARPRLRNQARRLLGALFFTVITAVVVGLLPGPMATTASALPTSGVATPGVCFVGGSGDEACPKVWGPPSLWSPEVLGYASARVADAMRAFESEAINQVLTDHDLPATDRDAVLSYARGDAEANLWALVLQSLRTAPADRSEHQQAIVDWLGELLTNERQPGPEQAALEYAKFAGKNIQALQRLLDDGASESQIKDFLTGDPEPYNTTDEATATGGYCKYRPPAPFQDQYDGSTLQSCFTPCQNIFGCAPPTPSYDQFVQWGGAHLGHFRPGVGSVLTQGDIASATVFGALGTELGGAGAGALLTNVLDGTSLVRELFPNAGGASELFSGSTDNLLLEQALDNAVEAANAAAEDAGDAAFSEIVESANAAAEEAFTAAVESGAGELAELLAVNAAAIGAGVAVAIAAVAIAVQVGLSVANLDQMPAKLAAAIAQSRERIDAGQYFGTPGGPSSVYQLFTDALAAPNAGGTCDDAAVYQKWQDWGHGVPVFMPRWGEDSFHITPCLNPTSFPAARTTDPHFVVRDIQTGQESDSPTITFIQGDKDTIDETARVNGDNWFEVRGALAPDKETRSLRIWYTDWQGRNNLAWLGHTDSGWRFYGVQAFADGSMLDSPQACTQCWSSDRLQYVGPDGHQRTARIVDYVPPTGQPFVATAKPLTGQPVTFDAGGFQPGETVGDVTYQWRFQQQCGDFGCMHEVDTTPDGPFPTIELQPVYGDPVAGATASNSWTGGGSYSAQLTATDSAGHQETTELKVTVEWVPPVATLARDCAVVPVPIGCNNDPTDAGSPSTLFGGVQLSSPLETADVLIDWGDGSGTTDQVGQDALHVPGTPISWSPDPSGNGYIHDLRATHTYAAAGIYHVTLTAYNHGGVASSTSAVLTIKGPSQISFDQPADRRYGASFAPNATGSNSGFPVTFTASPADVCTADDQGTVTAVGLGDCTVTAHQAGGGPIYEDAPPVSRTFHVGPAPLRVSPDAQTKTYGDPNPEFTAHFSGLRNGDTAADLTGLQIQGPAAGSHAGTYPIVASGITDPNYDVTYDQGQLQVRPAALTVTPDDQTRVYGDPAPAYTATFDGLVNGDQPADITGLKYQGAGTGSHVGSYDILVQGGTDADYEYHYAKGTERITPAPLTITADDKTHTYGTTAQYSATYQGLVYGEQGVPGLTFAGAPAKAAVGSYPIVPSGSTDPDYDVTYVNGTESITPASLTIRADNQTRDYGAGSPAYTTTFSGLQNGDVKSSVTGLTVTGAPVNAAVGSYPIVPSGGVNANYAIHYVNGTESVTRAPLTITAKDASKVYGAPDPVFGATYDGLVNGDFPAAIGGLQLSAAPTGSDVGTYSIVASGASNPNYDIAFVNGTESITPAPLTIRAQDATAKYGTVATYSWKGDGWVNGDNDASIDTAPACQATVKGAAASNTTLPGAYVGAITCSGAADHNYAIGYASGKLTVDPVVTLDETGLPSTVPHRATMDGQSVNLPVTAVEVGFGTSHGWSFPGVVVDAKGITYLATAAAFQGPVVANTSVTATYTTMNAYVDQALKTKGVDSNQVTPLKSKWAVVQSYLAAGDKAGAQAALQDFAKLVRSQSGKKISTATANQLLAYAQIVYTSVDGGTL
jgi:hypothetical protein